METKERLEKLQAVRRRAETAAAEIALAREDLQDLFYAGSDYGFWALALQEVETNLRNVEAEVGDEERREEHRVTGEARSMSGQLTTADVIRAAGGTRQAIKVLDLLLNSDLLAAPERSSILTELRREIVRHHPPRDPRVGDSVILRGRIEALVPDFGHALIQVDRPAEDSTGVVYVQAGSLEHDDVVEYLDGGVARA